jgi:molybdate transport system permease protein
MNELWQAIRFSLFVTLLATALVAAVGVPLAFVFARRRFVGKSVIEALLLVPLVLPPTVVGYLLILLLGHRSPLGRGVEAVLGHPLLFSWQGAVVSAGVVALPLLFLPAKAAFAGIEPELEDVARVMGANGWQTFWHVSLPLARRGIASGLLLAFARALGEFGATVMVLGDLEGRRTLPILIYNDFVAGDLRASTAVAVSLLSAISLVIMLLYNRPGMGGR